ncbi:MAG: hypothetical protein R3185_07960, partial [Candidatus Thermoplasmatota archaeon]|nr:hypothetical protein [Candidatus Thermoplasmatota archaeon]
MGTLQRLCTGAGASVAALGVTVLFGWVLDVDPLKTVVPGFESMKVNTAQSLLLLGTGLAIRSRHPQVGGWKLGTARALSGLAVFLGSSTLLVDILQVTNPLDELVIPDDTQTLTGVPGRMSPLTALSFILLGSALILPWEKPRQVQATRLLAGATVFVLLFPAFGYAYNATELLGAVRASTGMAVHTLVGLSVLAAGVLLAPSVEGEALFLASSKPAARLLRILSVLIILGPVGVASGLLFLRFTGWVPPGLLAPLGSVAVAVLFSGVLLWAARSLAHLDHAREGLLGDLEQERDLLDRRVSERTQELQASNEELEASNEELRVTTEELTEANRSLAAARADLEAMVQEVRDHAIYQIDPVGRVVTWNQGGQRIHGF